MRERLNIHPDCEGFLFSYDAERDPAMPDSHWHAELELNLVVRGQVTYLSGGRRHRFDRRAMIWLFPGEEHQLVERSADAVLHVAVFRPGLVKRCAKGAHYRDLGKRRAEEGLLHTVLDPESFEFVRRTTELLLRESKWEDSVSRSERWGRPDVVFCHGDPEGLNAGLRHLLLLAWRCRGNGRAVESPPALHPSVRRALRLLEDEGEGADGKALARACGVSPAYLSRVFAKEVGMPLARYRSVVRLRRFWRLMRGETRPAVTEAVFAAGFGSYAQFYKVFVREYGQGPRECLGERVGAAPQIPA
jgi:methylphosphotriester-DNA--protein-cysteine methyltransferase